MAAEYDEHLEIMAEQREQIARLREALKEIAKTDVWTAHKDIAAKALKQE